MADQILKIDDTTVQITSTPLPQTVISIYDVSVVKQQMINSQALEDEYVAARQGERLTLQVILDQAATVGVIPDKVAPII